MTESRPIRHHDGANGGRPEGPRLEGATHGSGIPIPMSRPRRIVIDNVLPQVDHGLYPVKRTVREPLDVTAHLVADGHDLIRAAVLYRRADAEGWDTLPMSELGNDEWRASVTWNETGRYVYTVQAWIDRYGSWATDLEKRVFAGWDVSSELLEGAALVSEAAERASWPEAERLRVLAARLTDASVPPMERAGSALDPEYRELASAFPDLELSARYEQDLEVVVSRERARFGAWYEMFPRSQGDDPARGATLREAARRFPDIEAMGFDVLYLPPIHPIGATDRKGPNNALHAGPGDPGSPWAIGSEAGGHDAVSPELGTIDDFDWFVGEAQSHGLEIALDIAFQASPDHPYVRQHPEWFRHRPDGSIKYAENPPKQYQDVYPLDFETEAWESLWQELRRVFAFWAEHGVRIFRVDNPHTKPLAFWEWVIADIKREYPDALFLAEAFTRPKRMHALAKLGFDQSYTYFTWRNTKSEIVEYFTELSTSPSRDLLRPNLFVNTPDILHEYLQTGGRAAFLVRLTLAATLGPSYGIYSGYELTEADAVPGTEDYLDSDKYQVKVRDWDAPGNIKPAIARLNQLRRQLPALQFTEELWFLPVNNDELVAFIKSDPEGGGFVLTVVNLDVRGTQEGYVGLPLAALGFAADEGFIAHDLLNEHRFNWRGEWAFVRLDPRIEVAHVFVFEPELSLEAPTRTGTAA